MNLLLPEKTADLSPQQQGWLNLSEMKANCFDDLQKSELQIQVIVKDYESMNLETIQEKLKEAKSKAADAKDRRLHFTKMLDEKLIQPAMVYEKRNDELLGKVSGKELELRKEAAARQDKVNAYNQEISQLKAHIINEYQKIATDYKNALLKTISDIYVAALKEKIKVKDLPNYIESSASQLTAIQLGKPNKFTRNLVDDGAAKKVLDEIEKYNSVADYENAVAKLKGETFGMYAEDLKNAEAAIEFSAQAAMAATASNEEALKLETATNTLIAAAEPVIMVGSPKVKKIYKIALEDNEQFAMKVLATFIKNWPEASKKIGVKSWTKLVDPFVKAIEKLDTQFPDFKYEEICK